MVQARSLGQLPEQVPQAVRQLLYGEKRSGQGGGAGTAVIQAPAKPFPWARVGSAGAVAAVGLGVALGWGVPAMLTVMEAEDAYFAAGADDYDKHQDITAAQEKYMAGPVWGLAVGGTLGLVAAGYATYVAVSHEE